MVRLAAAMLLVALTGCAAEPRSGARDSGIGGPCVYDDFEGTCTVTGEGTFRFEGMVDGEAVELGDNALGQVDVGVGGTLSCTLSLEIEGTCTPCGFDIGSCGDDAWALSSDHY